MDSNVGFYDHLHIRSFKVIITNLNVNYIRPEQIHKIDSRPKGS
jgi:hypothetical protein